jgi:aspartyl-tRNA(Asn)/glutamyl-tRNA(Gln) amidotransferase subunit C
MISKEEVQKLAELARLELTDAEVEGLQKDISNILDYVGQVSKVEMSDTKVAGVVHNVMRQDAVRTVGDTMLGKEESLRAAFPKREGNFNVVRKIIQKDE